MGGGESREEGSLNSPRIHRRFASTPFLLSLWLLGCDGGEHDANPAVSASNLVALTLDTTRADHFGAYGYFRDTTPRIDALAKESLVFERCIAPMATTLPSHTSLMTATDPLEHGIVANFKDRGLRFRPSPRLKTLAEVARGAGYQTGAFVSAAPLKRQSGIDAGFDVFDEPEEAERTAKQTNRRVKEWLAQLEDGPFFLWVHYFDPHHGYRPPGQFASLYQTDAAMDRYLQERDFDSKITSNPRHDINRYDGEIRFLDEQIGRLLDELEARGKWQNTVLLMVADHGEGLGQHGEPGHGSVWEEQLHVPLLMRIPGVAPQRISTTLGIPDVLPTLLGQAESLPFQELLSQSSGADVMSQAGEGPGILSLEVRKNVEEEARVVLTTSRWKLIHDPEGPDVLFDREADPFELKDVLEAHPAVADRLSSQLQEQLATQRERGAELRPSDASEEAMDPALLEELRALGYTGDE